MTPWEAQRGTASSTLQVAGIVKDSVVDGPGIRLAVFVQGCPHQCPGCHNQHTQAFAGGKTMTVDEILRMLQENPFWNLTLSGGEPFAQAAACTALAQGARALGKHVTTYTGGIYEELLSDPAMRPLVEASDLLIDGPFVQAQRTLEEPFRGSSNQRVIDVQKSLTCGEVVLWMYGAG